MRRRLKRMALWAVLSVGVYIAVVLAGSAVRTEGSTAPNADGPRIWVIAGLIHTDIVVPLRYGATDLSNLVATPAFSADAATLDYWRREVSHVAISWGARDFFVGVPTWDKLRPWHVAASIWDDSALHATLIERPWDIDGAVELQLSTAQYEALVAGFDATVKGGLDDPVPLPAMGYTPSDGFYASDEIYHAFRTCNVWTAHVLDEAGISVGVWTPYPQGLMWSLRRGRSARPLQEPAT